jgi:hypothetical protein
MIYLTDRQLMILLGIRDGKSYEEMTAPDYLNKSKMTVWKCVKELIEMGLVENVHTVNGKTKVRGRKLTPSGERALKNEGHDIKRVTAAPVQNPTSST